MEKNTSNSLKVAVVKFVSWDEERYFLFDEIKEGSTFLKKGSQYLFDILIGEDLAEVIEIIDNVPEDFDQKKIEKMIRVASDEDIDISKKNNLNNKKILRESRKIIKKYNMDMKLSDLHISYDDGIMVFSFIADGRVDFRELVKELSKKYKKKIRLYQLGVRDEAKLCGDIGDCGQILCCKRFLKRLESINTGFARDQQIAHRGLDKLSGMCGRLKCCLAYEEKHYQELILKLPQIGEKVKTKDGEGVVIELFPLKLTARIRLDKDGAMIQVKY